MKVFFLPLMGLIISLCFFSIESGLVKNSSISTSSSSSKISHKNDSINLLSSSGSKKLSLNYDNSKIDKALEKCYACITKKDVYNDKVCSKYTGSSTISEFGIFNAPNAVYNAAYWSTNLPLYSNTYSTYNTAINAFSNSLSCMVGPSGDAVAMACEYGNSYCQVEFISSTFSIYYACAPVCWPSEFTICTTGTLSNKAGPICLTGISLDTINQNQDDFLYPVQCGIGEVCETNIEMQSGSLVSIKSFCSPDCYPHSVVGSLFDSLYECSYTDFSNKQGPLCYVGTFGTNAELRGCPNKGDFCLVTKLNGQLIGTCSSTSTPTGIVVISSSQKDFGNKQGPICFVGQFGDYSPPIACLSDQVCQGSCITNCVSSATTFCCKTDLCNAYESQVNNHYNEPYKGATYL